MVASLPLCAAIQSKYNEKYLSYVKEDGNKAHKHVRFSGEEIVSRSTKFAIERSSKHKELVHLRCCHNNKYLVRKSEVEQWIIAAAEKPEEDNSIWSSTLFEPIAVENSDGYGQTVLRLKHCQTRLYACMMLDETDDDDDDDSLSNCLYLGSTFEDPDPVDVVKIIDWGTLVILPKRVAFKSSTHGKYLVSSPSNQRDGHGYPCIRSAADDKALASVIQEVVTNPNGTIGIKSCDTDDGLWTSNDIGEIDVEPLVSNEKTLDKWIFQKFSPIKVSSNVIALRCPSFNKFCNINGDSLQLECKASSILREAKFAVEEVVVSRDVYNIIFHLDDARIYDELTLVLATSTITNSTENTYHNQEEVFKFQDKRSSTWTNGGSLSLGVKVNFTSQGVPFISENGSIVIGEKSFEGQLEWGETQTEIFEMEKTYSTSVPPKTESVVRLVCTIGTCDVPFSYTVREVHADGKTLVYQADDGVYTAMNSYNSHIGIENKPI